MKCFYETSDKSLKYEFHFIQKSKLVMTHLGKTYPKHTQCLMFENGLLKHFSTIKKHSKDDDDLFFALRYTFEDCIKNINLKWLRNEIRNDIIPQIRALANDR